MVTRNFGSTGKLEVLLVDLENTTRELENFFHKIWYFLVFQASQEMWYFPDVGYDCCLSFKFLLWTWGATKALERKEIGLHISPEEETHLPSHGNQWNSHASAYMFSNPTIVMQLAVLE